MPCLTFCALPSHPGRLRFRVDLALCLVLVLSLPAAPLAAQWAGFAAADSFPSGNGPGDVVSADFDGELPGERNGGAERPDGCRSGGLRWGWPRGARIATMAAEMEIFLRLGAATAIGAVVGLNRDLHGKPSGIRTLGLVGLGAALVVLASMDFKTGSALDADPVSRAIQGILTGIGFLGAGVIVRDSLGKTVQGLTTAALIWLTACLGIVCGLGAWKVAFVSLFFILVLLSVGGVIERWLHRVWGRGPTDESRRPPP